MEIREDHGKQGDSYERIVHTNLCDRSLSYDYSQLFIKTGPRPLTCSASTFVYSSKSNTKFYPILDAWEVIKYCFMVFTLTMDAHSLILFSSLHAEELSVEGAIPGKCGGTINLDQTSPISHFNVTNSYPSSVSVSCSWYINSPPNTMIVVDFYDWQLLDNKDFMRIFDSRGRQIFYANPYGRLNQAPNPFISDSSAHVFFYGEYNTLLLDTYFGVKVSYIGKYFSNSGSIMFQ